MHGSALPSASQLVGSNEQQPQQEAAAVAAQPPAGAAQQHYSDGEEDWIMCSLTRVWQRFEIPAPTGTSSLTCCADAKLVAQSCQPRNRGNTGGDG